MSTTFPAMTPVEAAEMMQATFKSQVAHFEYFARVSPSTASEFAVQFAAAKAAMAQFQGVAA